MSDEPVKNIEKKQEKKREKRVNATRISGLKNGCLLFRFDGGERSLRFRLVPQEDWQGKDTQSFDETVFKNYDTPAFFGK